MKLGRHFGVEVVIVYIKPVWYPTKYLNEVAGAKLLPFYIVLYDDITLQWGYNSWILHYIVWNYNVMTFHYSVNSPHCNFSICHLADSRICHNYFTGFGIIMSGHGFQISRYCIININTCYCDVRLWYYDIISDSSTSWFVILLGYDVMLW